MSQYKNVRLCVYNIIHQHLLLFIHTPIAIAMTKTMMIITPTPVRMPQMIHFNCKRGRERVTHTHTSHTQRD